MFSADFTFARYSVAEKKVNFFVVPERVESMDAEEQDIDEETQEPTASDA